MNHLRYSIIFACFLIGLFTLSCEKTGLQTTDASHQKISSRSVEECEDCPNDDDCCCAVELQNPTTQDALLSLCGTSDGASACSEIAVGTCSAISGGGQVIYIQPGDSRRLFCMGPGNPLRIRNLNSSANANIFLTCQHGQTNAQIVPLSIPPSTSVFYGVGGTCLLTECD